MKQRMKACASPYRPSVVRTVRHSVLLLLLPQTDHPGPVDPDGPVDIIVEARMVRGRRGAIVVVVVVHTNAWVIPPGGRPLSRLLRRPQPVHGVLPYRRDDLGEVGGDVRGQPGGHETRPTEVRVVLGRRLRAGREHLRRRGAALAIPGGCCGRNLSLNALWLKCRTPIFRSNVFAHIKCAKR